MSTLKITKNNFESEVINSDKPVLIDFWAEWCGPCKMIAPVVDEISSESGEFVKVCKVNVDEEPELAASFKVMSIPSLIVMKEGKVTNSAVGVRPKQAILDMIGV